MNKLKNYIKFIKNNPTLFMASSFMNFYCLFTNSYNEAFDNDIFNFIFCEVAILFLYFMVFHSVYKAIKK